MKINLAQSSGFCFGVKRAIQIAEQTAKSNRRVYMLGDIVHNEDVVRQINKAGIKKITKLSQGKGQIFLIRAHGISRANRNKTKARGYQIVDATCPMVKEIHTIARRMERAGYRIIVIGEKRHDEVQGIIGQLKHRAIVIDPHRPIPLKALQKIKQAAVVVQSTQNVEQVRQIVAGIKQYIKKLQFCNTICKPTRTKQAEIRTLALKNQVVVIIGSKTSANTKRLYEIAKSLNKNSFWVQSKSNLSRNWFKGVNSVGIMAGASTPDSTTQAVIEQISHYS